MTGASLSVATAGIGVLNAPITLSANGLPSGVTVSFSPSTLGGAGASTTGRIRRCP